MFNDTPADPLTGAKTVIVREPEQFGDKINSEYIMDASHKYLIHSQLEVDFPIVFPASGICEITSLNRGASHIRNINDSFEALFKTLTEVEHTNSITSDNGSAKLRVTETDHKIQTSDVIRVTNNTLYQLDAICTRISANVFDTDINDEGHPNLEYHIIKHHITGFTQPSAGVVRVASAGHGLLVGQYAGLENDLSNAGAKKVIAKTNDTWDYLSATLPTLGVQYWTRGSLFPSIREITIRAFGEQKLFSLMASQNSFSSGRMLQTLVTVFKDLGIIRDFQQSWTYADSAVIAHFGLTNANGLKIENCRIGVYQNLNFDSVADITLNTTKWLTISGFKTVDHNFDVMRAKLRTMENLFDFKSDIPQTSRIFVNQCVAELNPQNFYAAGSFNQSDRRLITKASSSPSSMFGGFSHLNSQLDFTSVIQNVKIALHKITPTINTWNFIGAFEGLSLQTDTGILTNQTNSEINVLLEYLVTVSTTGASADISIFAEINGVKDNATVTKVNMNTASGDVEFKIELLVKVPPVGNLQLFVINETNTNNISIKLPSRVHMNGSLT